MSMSLLSALLPPTLAQNPSHFSSYHHPLLLTSLATLTGIIHPGTPTHRKTNQAKICLTGSYLLIFYLLTTPNITPYYTVPPETAPLLISLWFLPKQPLNAYDRIFQTSVQIIFLSLLLFLHPL